MSRTTRNMTEGSPVRHVLLFALPLMLGYICQQLYTMTDAAIVGRFAGVEALSAVGCTDWLSWMGFSLVTGFMQGFGIPISQRFGAGDMKGMRRCISTCMILGLLIAAAFTLVGTALVRPMLRWIGTNERIFDSAAEYLTILYAGILCTAVNHLFGTFLRAVGNSRVPFLAMIVSAVINIALDLWFVVGLRWNVKGAAVATVISQAIAAAFCAAAFFRIEVLRFPKGEFTFDRGDAKKAMRLAAPMALQYVLISVGGLFVQARVNAFGFVYVAGFAATGKFCGLQEQAAIAYGQACTTYVGQNLGAGRMDRVRSGIRKTAILALVTSFVMGGFMILIARPALSLFIEPGADPRVTQVALNYLYAMSGTLCTLYLLMVYRSSLYGLGDTLRPAISSLIQVAMRIAAAWLGTIWFGRGAINFAETAAWLGALIMMYLVFRYRTGEARQCG